MDRRRHQHRRVDVARGRQHVDQVLPEIAGHLRRLEQEIGRPTISTDSFTGARPSLASTGRHLRWRERHLFDLALETRELERHGIIAGREKRQNVIARFGGRCASNALQVRRRHAHGHTRCGAILGVNDTSRNGAGRALSRCDLGPSRLARKNTPNVRPFPDIPLLLSI